MYQIKSIRGENQKNFWDRVYFWIRKNA